MNRPFIFLDLDDTILDFHWAEHRALRKAMGEMGLDPTDELLDRYSAINRQQWELLEDGRITREEVLLSRFEILFGERGIGLSAAELRDRYESQLCFGYRFLPGAEEMLDELRGKVRLYLASNGSAAIQHARLKSAGLSGLFDGVFISEEMGVNKPSTAYFDLCFSKIPGFSRERALMVGDSLSSDIRGGLRAGIRTCWLNPGGKPPRADITPDYEIRDLSELPPLIDRVFR